MGGAVGLPVVRLTSSRRGHPRSWSRALSDSSLALPAAAECFVELHDRRELVACGAREIDVGREELPLRIEDVEIGTEPIGVAKVGDVQGTLRRLHPRLLLCADVARRGPKDQRRSEEHTSELQSRSDLV